MGISRPPVVFEFGYLASQGSWAPGLLTSQPQPHFCPLRPLSACFPCIGVASGIGRHQFCPDPPPPAPSLLYTRGVVGSQPTYFGQPGPPQNGLLANLPRATYWRKIRKFVTSPPLSPLPMAHPCTSRRPKQASGWNKTASHRAFFRMSSGCLSRMTIGRKGFVSRGISPTKLPINRGFDYLRRYKNQHLFARPQPFPRPAAAFHNFRTSKK